MNRSENRLLPVLTDAPGTIASRAKPAHRQSQDAGVFTAQLFGQVGQKRGLRGGTPVLDAARAAYLGAEYSGEQDRRPTPGLLKRAVV